MIDTEKYFRIAIDTGGTFVDAVEFNDNTGALRLAKSPTTPRDPTVGVLNVIDKLATPLSKTYLIIYGTTLGINAILQGKGASTGLITNEGFRDIFEIGRGDVPPKHMYNFNYPKPKPLIRRRHILGIPGRINYKGEVVKELDLSNLRNEIDRMVNAEGIKSFAVCFLHSYRNPVHEHEVLNAILDLYPDASISLSCEVAREYREYERTATTVLDAYIKPIVNSHILKLEKLLRERGFDGIFLVMRSDGGVMTASQATKSPIRTIQSGPAGGVIGAIQYANSLGLKKVISIDVGGTSLDACTIVNNYANVVHQTYVEHYPLLLTAFDIRSIGAGGGSIAYIDEDEKLLKVGPDSAGADPGPMCYSRGGTRPTITDAAVCLGYIEPARFLRGEMILNKQLAVDGIKRLIADRLDISLEEAAAGMFKVMIANSCSAVRQITVEEGHCPEEFVMVAFGGAGPMIAPILAREVGVPRVVIPIVPANFSAYGMLMADIKSDMSQTVLEKLDESAMIKFESIFHDMETKLSESITELHEHYVKTELRRSLEMRYIGQEHALEVDVHPRDYVENVKERFNQLHYMRYGHKMPYDVEVINVRVTATGVLRKPSLRFYPKDLKEKKIGTRKAYCLVLDKLIDFTVVDRNSLNDGDVVNGPAVIDEGVSVTIIHTGQALTVDKYGSLIIEV